METTAIFDRLLRIACWSGLVVGSCFLLLAIAFAIDTEVFLHRSVQGTAQIVRLNSSHDDFDNTVSFAPVFTFTTPDGRSYTVTSNVSTNPAGYNVGQQVLIRYYTDQPSGARLLSFTQLWIFPIIFGIVGAVAAGIGYGLWRYARSRARRNLSASRLGKLDVPTLAQLLQDAERHHADYESTAPKHPWSDWYAAYIVARLDGKTPEEAASAAKLQIEGKR